MPNKINNKFYDFINMYNAIIKHCMNQERKYDIKLFFVEGKMYFQIIDKNSQVMLHNTELECNKEECDLIYYTITNEFILNHQIRFAAYSPMNEKDILLYHTLTKGNNNITSDERYYLNNNKPMQIHVLENTMFTLNIYQYDGVDTQTELLHDMALEKANARNHEIITLKK